MDEIRTLNNRDNSIENVQGEGGGLVDLAELTDNILQDARNSRIEKRVYRMPVSELAALGTGVASLLPELRTVTQTTTVNTEGLYSLANAAAGDVLKVKKDGNYWGALKTVEGKSKLAQLKKADPVTVTNKTVSRINPAVMMMAFALFSIEQKLETIEETGQQILSFLEIEKESEIEADLDTLVSILEKYKYNWNNDQFISGAHQIVLDIQRTSRKHMNLYQKQIAETANSKHFITRKTKVNAILQDLQKKFSYYRLALYTFSMASFEEILLSRNFEEDNVVYVLSELEKLSLSYRELFTQSSVFLEKAAEQSVETNVIKGIGSVSRAAGSMIGKIPIVKKGPVDEILQENGSQIKSNAEKTEKNIVESLSKSRDPGTGLFMDKLKDIICIFNHTGEICCDEKRIYLITT